MCVRARGLERSLQSSPSFAYWRYDIPEAKLVFGPQDGEQRELDVSHVWEKSKRTMPDCATQSVQHFHDYDQQRRGSLFALPLRLNVSGILHWPQLWPHQWASIVVAFVPCVAASLASAWPDCSRADVQQDGAILCGISAGGMPQG